MVLPPGVAELILEAAQEGDLTLIRSYNALHCAASIGESIPTCRFLIHKLKFDINAPDFAKGDTPLLHAVAGKHQPTVMYLINSGADITKSDVDGCTPLHYAVEVGSTELVKLLISKGADFSASSNAGTPVHIAADCGRVEILKYLLELKADPNCELVSMSPLWCLCMLYWPEALCATYAVHSSYVKLICLELTLFAPFDVLQQQIYERQELIQMFVPFMLQHLYFFAAGIRDEKMIRSLLKAGADPNMTEGLGKTPLELAAFCGFREVFKLLLPVTSRIECYPYWSISGVMHHVHSSEASAQWKSKREELFLMAKENGRVAFEKKDYMKAIYWYTQASQADQADARVLSNQSLCWALLNDGGRALREAQACVDLDPSWSKAHYREGAAWKLLKKFDKAAEAFSRALALDPRNKGIEEEYRNSVYFGDRAVDAECRKSSH
ncbi:OLC1v1023672C1 [Oldenlandia corymbosa var. corymbosa]|uniref:OLC1v1023672C1 n=1 Tax=Oldenlandia corymbosa var. corymbosa TaxID=529605 RepID=A0AAV1C0Y3_OLDCO|nr:OLC1v1023672C1 [Oldenlandia corymbosa var. corymbosa]